MAWARMDVRGTPDFSQCEKEVKEKEDADKRRAQHTLKKRTESAE